VKELHQSGLGVSAIAKQLNIGRSSVYRSLA
jgi:predicted transcriptional regulator